MKSEEMSAIGASSRRFHLPPAPQGWGDEAIDIRVVVAEPKHEGNVGAVARAMGNFGAKDLILVRPCRIGEEARKRAMHATSILDAARAVDSLEDALADVDLVVGTSGIETTGEKRFARIAISPRELAARVASIEGTIALLFGREDFGLFDGELAKCDLLVTIPASKESPVLNLSHAAAILLYELSLPATSRPHRRPASGMEKEKLHEAFTSLLEAADYPTHKRARTRIMFRRLLGRAAPSKWEFHALMGVFQRATKRIQRLEGKR
jgi:tRNA/rRNA methyltransferase